MSFILAGRPCVCSKNVLCLHRLSDRHLKKVSRFFKKCQLKKPILGRDGISTLKRTHKCTHPYASVHTPTRTCMCAHTQTYTYMRAHTHTYTHTCTHMHRQNGQDSGAPMARGKKKDTDNPDTQSNALVQMFIQKKKR